MPTDEGTSLQALLGEDTQASSTTPNGHRGRSNKPSWAKRAAWGLGVAGVIAVAAAVVLVFTGKGGLSKVIGHQPERTPFAFATPVVHQNAIAGAPAKDVSAKDAEQVRDRLSRLYDTAFMNPDTWAKGLPADVWEGFTQDAAAKAKADPGALALGREARLARLEVTKAELTINVLFDTKKRPEAIIATVVFQATGRLKDGSPVDVQSTATFLFRSVSGRWLVAGFPSARVTMDSAAPSPKSTGPGASSS
jgi:ketosteroid isomerase-like protein